MRRQEGNAFIPTPILQPHLHTCDIEKHNAEYTILKNKLIEAGAKRKFTPANS